MQKPTSWRDLLGRVIENSLMRQRLADQLGVSQITLLRWVKQESRPRVHNLHNLLASLPEYHDELLVLLKEEFPDFSMAGVRAVAVLDADVIPSDFYTRFVHTISHTPKSLQFSLLCNLILEQALKQLDPNRLGMAIIIVCCMPRSLGNKVRSLREIQGRGTPPWGERLEQRSMLLGVESLAGHVVLSGHLEVNQALQASSGTHPGYRAAWEESAAASPIMYAGAIAGSLLVSSTQPDYFSQLRCTLIEQYARLLALAFAPEAFYESEEIQLLPLPPYEVQYKYLSRFRQHVIQLLRQAAQRGAYMHLLQAEQIAWQEIEADLFSDVPFAQSQDLRRSGHDNMQERIQR